MKAIKKEGKMTPLHGISDTGVVLTGTAYMGSGGTAYFDVLASVVHGGGTGTQVRFGWTGDKDFNGSGFFDNNGDGAVDGSQNFAAVDCDTLTFP